jgi:phosphohistidine phosphatase SixA
MPMKIRYLHVVRSLKDSPRDSEEVVMIFGHNPGLTAFANALLNETIDNIPTCGIVAAELPVERWQDVTFGCGAKCCFLIFRRASQIRGNWLFILSWLYLITV